MAHGTQGTSEDGATPDDLARRRLLLAKRFFLRGEELSRTGEDFDSMLAVHHLHLAIEVTLRAICLKFGIQSKRVRPGFEELLMAVQADEGLKARGLGLPLLVQVGNINAQRNLVQHDVRMVHATALEDARVITRLFLQDVFRTFFETDIDSLSELVYVADPRLRSFCVTARELVALNRRLPRVIAGGALRLCLDCAIGSLPLESDEQPEIGFHLMNPYVARRLDRLEQELVLLASGASVVDYRWFTSLTPRVVIDTDDSLAFDVTNCEDISTDTLLRAERFVVECILTWQRRGLAPMFTQGDRVLTQMRDVADHLIREPAAA